MVGRGVAVNSDGTFGVKGSTMEGLLDEASKVLDGHPKLAIASWSSAVCGASRDTTFAFSHSGATLGLIAGEVLPARSPA